MWLGWLMKSLTQLLQPGKLCLMANISSLCSYLHQCKLVGQHNRGICTYEKNENRYMDLGILPSSEYIIYSIEVYRLVEGLQQSWKVLMYNAVQICTVSICKCAMVTNSNSSKLNLPAANLLDNTWNTCGSRAHYQYHDLHVHHNNIIHACTTVIYFMQPYLHQCH